MWTHRFKAVEEHPVWTLADLENEVREAPSLRWERTDLGPAVFLGQGPNGTGRACLLRIPGMPAVDFIRLRCRLTAHHLNPGPEDWQDGRLVFENTSTCDSTGMSNAASAAGSHPCRSSQVPRNEPARTDAVSRATASARVSAS